MKSYPISTGRDNYRGANPSKQRKAANYNRVAQLVADYINSRLKDKPTDTVYTILSHEVASDLREDSDLVHSIIFGIDCGSNGVTIFKGDYEKALENPKGI